MKWLQASVYLVLVLLVSSVSSQAEDAGCEATRQRVESFIVSLNDVKADFDKLALKCIMDGGDDAAFAEKEKALTYAFQKMNEEAAAADQCSWDTNKVAAIVKGVSTATGQSFGLALMHCTTEGQKIFNDTQISREDKQQKIKAYIEQAMQRVTH